MIVADLIRLLSDFDPDAIVLIPRDTGLGHGTEMLADVVPVPAACFSGGPAATSEGVRLSGLPAAAMLVVTGVVAGSAV
jgi:hypothetical protein